ncbi:MAG: hypothetical protein ACI9K5_003797, partial [Gammaproteobacteria bacterium]
GVQYFWVRTLARAHGPRFIGCATLPEDMDCATGSCLALHSVALGVLRLVS